MLTVEKITIALKKSFSRYEADQRAANQFIEDHFNNPLFLEKMLQAAFSYNEGKDKDLMQAALIQGKNFVERHKKDFSQDHVNRLKPLITEGVVLITEKTSSTLLQEIFHHLAEVYFPEHWGGLVEQINSFIQSGDELKIRGGLLLMKQLFMIYEHQTDQKRELLDQMIEAFFGSMIEVYMTALEKAQVSQIAQYFVLQTIKIFYSISQLKLPQLLLNPHDDFFSFKKWYELLSKAIHLPLPDNLHAFPHNELEQEQLESETMWLIKDQVSKILFRLFQRYGNAYTQSPEEKSFSQFFRNNYMANILTLFMQLVEADVFISTKTCCNALRLISLAIKYKETQSLVLDNIQPLLQKHLIKYLALPLKDRVLFSEDEIEFIRKSRDYSEKLFSLRGTAMDVIHSALSFTSPKNRSPLFDQFCNFLFETLVSFNSNPTFDPYQKEACVYLLGGLLPLIIKVDSLKDTLLPGLEQTVLPDMQSSHSILRMRAIWMYQKILSQDQALPIQEDSLIEGIVNTLGNCMQNDQSLPVKVEAAIAIQFTFNYPCTQRILQSSLGDVLSLYLKIINEIDLDEVVAALQTLIQNFDKQMAPYALDLAEHLAHKFVELTEMLSKNDVEDDSNEALSSVEMLNAVYRVVASCQQNEKLMMDLWPIVKPALDLSLQDSDTIETFPDGCSLLNLFIAYSPSTSHLWEYYDNILSQVTGLEQSQDLGWAYQYLGRVTRTVKLFISADPDRFAQSPSMIGKIIVLTQKLQNSKNKSSSTSELDIIHSLAIFNALMEHCKGKIDERVRDFLQFVMIELAEAKTEKLKIKLWDTLSVALWYNSNMVLQMVYEKKLISQFLQAFVNITDVSQQDAPKHSFPLFSIGICSILSMNGLVSAPEVRIALNLVNYLRYSKINGEPNIHD